MSAVSKETLSYEVGYLLGLPRYRRGGKAFDIVTAVLKTIVNALQKGDEVKLQGFGIFRRHVLPARKVPNFSCSHKKGERYVWSKDYSPKTIPARTVIKFFPSKALIRYINNVNA